MNDALKSKMLEWLDSDDPVKRRHAQHRLNLIDTVSEAQEIRPDLWIPLIRACEYHNPACCSNPAPFCSYFMKNVSREDCIACLTKRGITPK